MPLIKTKQPKTTRKAKRTLTGGVKHQINLKPTLIREYNSLNELKEIILEMFDVAQVEKDTVAKHERLNDKLFEPSRGAGMVMKPAVREALLKIAHAFIDTWKLNIPVVDIIVTGSNANYNYTPYSDIDLHIVYDPGMDDNERITTIKNLLNTKKQLWAKQHDIHIKGLPVELYAQIAGEVNVAGGTYSVMGDNWIKKPTPEEFSSFGAHDQEITQKAEEFIKEIDELVTSHANEESINAMLEKIHQYRVAGLSKDGEASVENLVFKVLRNSGAIKKLFDARANLSDNDLSLSENYNGKNG